MPHRDAPTPTDDVETLTWEGFGQACDDLARQVTESGFRPRIVIAIARGGLLPAGALAYALDVELVDAINVERYSSASQAVPDPVMLAPRLDSASVAGEPILIVDDITDSGRTLGLVTRLLRGFGADVRSAVLFSKPNTVFPSDYLWRRTDGWVRFPWGRGATE